MNKPLPQIVGELRRRVNQLAHAEAVRHEIRTRERLIDQLRRLREGGADFAELSVRLDEIERADLPPA